MVSDIQMMKSGKKGKDQSIMDIQCKKNAEGETLMDEAANLSKMENNDRWVKALNDYNFDMFS